MARPKSRKKQGELTERQKEVLELLAEGKGPKQIAGILKISARTVEFHKYRVMEALELRSVPELAVAYTKEHSGDVITKAIEKVGRRVLRYISYINVPPQHQLAVRRIFFEQLSGYLDSSTNKSSQATTA